LPDAVADRSPAFVALLYHGRDTAAYEIAPAEVDRHIAKRVRTVKEGDPTPIDVRLTNGGVVRVQCAPLPNGGRIVTYAYVTDIVRHMDELEVLRSALDNVSEGVVLLDSNLNAQFLNRKVRVFWGVTEEQAAAHPSYASLLANSPLATARDKTPEELKEFNARRVESVRAGDATLTDLHTSDGRHLRAQCSVTKNNGRMLTYCDVSDLVNNARQMEELATTDSMTGLANRRHFLALAAAEWSRFQRYYRPLSVLMIDVDHFKSVNDRFGHPVGDRVLASLAALLRRRLRQSDRVGRYGGEEFATLIEDLPEAEVVRLVERLLAEFAAMEQHSADGQPFHTTFSAGVAMLRPGMSLDDWKKAADDALYAAKKAGRNRVMASGSPVGAGTGKHGTTGSGLGKR
jgi:diguanylate cyclase (GGDEF)-like protein